MRHLRLMVIPFSTLVLAIIGTQSWLPTADAQCDNKCRMRYFFLDKQNALAPCLRLRYGDCVYCTSAGGYQGECKSTDTYYGPPSGCYETTVVQQFKAADLTCPTDCTGTGFLESSPFVIGDADWQSFTRKVWLCPVTGLTEPQELPPE